jgi:hypothetical protein
MSYQTKRYAKVVTASLTSWIVETVEWAQSPDHDFSVALPTSVYDTYGNQDLPNLWIPLLMSNPLCDVGFGANFGSFYSEPLLDDYTLLTATEMRTFLYDTSIANPSIDFTRELWNLGLPENPPAPGGLNLGDSAPYGALTPDASFISTGATIFRGETGSSSYAFAPAGIHYGTSHVPASAGGAALDDMETAYQEGLNRTSTDVLAASLTGLTLDPGTHTSPGAVGATASTSMIFDGGGDSNAVWVMQIDGALNLGANFHMNLVDGAQAKNIYWQVAAAADIGASSTFTGTILANGAVSSGAGSVVYGRLLTRSGAVSVDSNELTSNEV